MKIIYILFITLLLLDQSGCMTRQAEAPEHYYAKVILEVDTSVQKDKSLRIYLNQENMNQTLKYAEKTFIYLQDKKNNLQVVQGYKTADITFEIKEGSLTRFKLLQMPNKSLIIVQIK